MTLKDLFKSGTGLGASGWVTRQLPNGAGSYSMQSPTLTPSGGFGPVSSTLSYSANTPLFKAGATPAAPTPVAPVAPVQRAPQQPQGPMISPELMRPDGTLYSPQEVVENKARALGGNKSPQASGDIGTYAGNQFSGASQGIPELQNTVAGLNNPRNDIATGTTDPYKAGAQSGIAYSPAELKAIEKAYAGIYDPAINTALAKLDMKQKEEAAAQESKQKLVEMAQQHKYNMEEKGLTGGGTPGGAEYVPGVDPVVDSYVDRINRGELATDIFRSIPGVANQGLRNKISIGLNATRYDSAKAAGSLDIVNEINKLLMNPKLENISGPVGQMTGGIFGRANEAKVGYNKLAASLQVLGAAMAKGQGQISDYERRIFKDASVAANRSMNDEIFRATLVNMKVAAQLASGLSALVKVTDPATGESRVYNLNREQVMEAEKGGAMIEGADETAQ